MTRRIQKPLDTGVFLASRPAAPQLHAQRGAAEGARFHGLEIEQQVGDVDDFLLVRVEYLERQENGVLVDVFGSAYKGLAVVEVGQVNPPRGWAEQVGVLRAENPRHALANRSAAIRGAYLRDGRGLVG